MYCTHGHVSIKQIIPNSSVKMALSGIRSKQRQVGSSTNKTTTRRNGDNLIGDNSVISATVKVKMAKKQQVKTATINDRRGGKRENEGRGKKKNH